MFLLSVVSAALPGLGSNIYRFRSVEDARSDGARSIIHGRRSVKTKEHALLPGTKMRLNYRLRLLVLCSVLGVFTECSENEIKGTRQVRWVQYGSV